MRNVVSVDHVARSVNKFSDVSSKLSDPHTIAG